MFIHPYFNKRQCYVFTTTLKKKFAFISAIQAIYSLASERNQIHKHRVWCYLYICLISYALVYKSNQIKSLLLSHHHSTSALVSEILMSVLQTVQKNNRQFTYGQTVQKNNKQFTYGQTVQKTALEHLQCSRQCKKTTTAIYIWTDSAKKHGVDVMLFSLHVQKLV